MLKISIVAVGKLKERFWREACDEYLKRLGGFAKVEVRELADSTPEREEALIRAALDALPAGTAATLLDVKGTPLSSEQLAQRIDAFATNGTSHLAFVIGGSEGVTPALAAQLDRISFGPITLPHNLARVVLLEQLYRAFKINSNHPYHK